MRTACPNGISNRSGVITADVLPRKRAANAGPLRGEIRALKNAGEASHRPPRMQHEPAQIGNGLRDSDVKVRDYLVGKVIVVVGDSKLLKAAARG